MRISLVLADDHPLILDALERLFALEKDLKVVARCVNGDETLKALRAHKPDVLILDIRLPEKDGIAVLEQIKKENLHAKVVILTAGIDEGQTVRALQLGARGIVLKDSAPPVLVQCIRKVHAGEQWFDQTVLGRTLERLLQRDAGRDQTGGVLTRRELEIVRNVVAGLQNKEVGQKLFISEGTVKVHLHSIYEKLGVDNRLQLVRYAREKGLV